MSRAAGATAGGRGATRKGRGRDIAARWRASPALGRWGWAVGLALAVVVLVPVMHALFGDLGVLIVGSLGLGFLLGRWTARR